MPALFDLTVAARSIVDDNYAWEVWETANGIRHSSGERPRDGEHLGREVWLDTLRLRLAPAPAAHQAAAAAGGLKPRKKEKYPGEWARQIDGGSICSYPPEDLVIEDYGRFLKQKGKSILSEERVRVEPFTTSMLDGIDLRETIRNWHEGKIYVRQFQKISGEVGSVIVIFDEDRDDRYPYLTTWLGENQNESDMAFYSTYPFDTSGGAGHRTRRIWRISDDVAAAAYVRRVERSGLRIRREQGGAAAAGRHSIIRSSVTWSMWRPSRRAAFSGRFRRAG